MSLDHLEAVPVDTHVFQIARDNYLPHLKKYKTVTQQVYKEIGDCFRNIFKKNAGWAHTVRSSYTIHNTFKNINLMISEIKVFIH